jgi:hypothetical protein
MTEHAGLERGYRWLLAWYPRAFWREHEEEMLGVLMAGALPGRERPSLGDAADVIKSALGMRLRRLWQGPRNQAWADALAVFSVAAPLFLLAADLLEVALPYRVPGNSAARFFGRAQIGGLSLLSLNFFDIAVGCQVIIAALVLLGLRRTALIAVAASAGYWAVARQWIPGIPYPLQLLASTVFLLEAVALIASPGPRRGRQLLTWGHGAVLVLAAAAVQAATLLYDATSPPVSRPAPGPGIWAYFWISVALAVAAVSVAVAVRMSWYFLLLLGVTVYPFVMQIAFPTNSSSNDLLGHPTPGDLALLYLPPLLLACWAILTAVLPRHSPVPMPADPDKPT